MRAPRSEFGDALPNRSGRAARIARSRRFFRPLLEFSHTTSAGGIVLLAATIVALVWSNVVGVEAYTRFFETKIGLSWGDAGFKMSIRHWVDDFLMSIFFLVVGLEIKRELFMGELSTRRKATLPALAALGGMVIPAGIFLLLNSGQASARAWGIPMATDIAFSLGLLSLLGNRVPTSLKVFLAAYAIVDDLGAILVITLFYSSGVNAMGLLVAAGFLLAMGLLNFMGVRRLFPYMALGLGVWAGIYSSGVHASIAGVLVAFTIPLWVRMDRTAFLERAKASLQEIEEGGSSDEPHLTDEEQYHLGRLERAIENAQFPLQRLENLLHSGVAFVVLPLFALANAGVPLGGGQLGSSLSLGIILGLVFGKPLGIVAFAWLGAKLKLCDLPKHSNWGQIVGVGFLGGVGFTMAIFISNLALDSAAVQNQAKLAILVASGVAAVVGLLIVKLSSRRRFRL
ncbi:MAG: Na+/H+ antiporter NhaA [Chthonomonas sp.]|nr:Na+/H+ antiporter NhaA [Chthonomonas sp.]